MMKKLKIPKAGSSMDNATMAIPRFSSRALRPGGMAKGGKAHADAAMDKKLIRKEIARAEKMEDEPVVKGKKTVGVTKKMARGGGVKKMFFGGATSPGAPAGGAAPPAGSAPMGAGLGGKRAAMQSAMQDTNQSGALSRAAMGQTQSAMPAANQSPPMRREPWPLRAELQALAAQGRTRLGPPAQGQSRAALQAGAGLAGLHELAMRGQQEAQQARGGPGTPPAGQGFSQMEAMRQLQAQAGAQQGGGMLQRTQSGALQGQGGAPAAAGLRALTQSESQAMNAKLRENGFFAASPAQGMGMPPTLKKGGAVKKMAKGGGVEKKGKTRGRFI